MMAMFRSFSADIGGASLARNPGTRKADAPMRPFQRLSTRSRTFRHAVQHHVRAPRIGAAMPHFPQDCCDISPVETVCFASSLQGELPRLEGDEAAARPRFWSCVEARARRQLHALEAQTGKRPRSQVDQTRLAPALLAERFRLMNSDARLHSADQLLDAGAERFCDAHENAERGVRFTGLQMRERRARHTGALGEILLSQLATFTQ